MWFETNSEDSRNPLRKVCRLVGRNLYSITFTPSNEIAILCTEKEKKHFDFCRLVIKRIFDEMTRGNPDNLVEISPYNTERQYIPPESIICGPPLQHDESITIWIKTEDFEKVYTGEQMKYIVKTSTSSKENFMRMLDVLKAE